jgi:hypothetical protein
MKDEEFQIPGDLTANREETHEYIKEMNREVLSVSSFLYLSSPLESSAAWRYWQWIAKIIKQYDCFA